MCPRRGSGERHCACENRTASLWCCVKITWWKAYANHTTRRSTRAQTRGQQWAPSAKIRMRQATACSTSSCSREGSREHLGLRAAAQRRLPAVPQDGYASAPKSSALSHMRSCALRPRVTACHPRACCSCTASRGRAICSTELTNRPKRDETARTILQTLGRDNGQRWSVLLVCENQRRAAGTTGAAVRKSEPSVLQCRAFRGCWLQRTLQLGARLPVLRPGERLQAAASEAKDTPVTCAMQPSVLL